MAHACTREGQDATLQKQYGSHFTKPANRAKEANDDLESNPAKYAGGEVWARRHACSSARSLDKPWIKPNSRHIRIDAQARSGR
jgi:hypothetical protein